MTGKAYLQSLFLHAVRAVEPATLVRKNLSVDGKTLHVGEATYDVGSYDEIRLFASGKAAVPMAEAAAEILGDHLKGGMVIAPETTDLPGLRVLQGDHPIPTERSLETAAELKAELAAMPESGFFIYLLSGGSSALMELPAPGLSLEDINRTGRIMLEYALPIEAVNCIRKHISAIKGGQLGAATQAKGAVLVLSDVIGDDLEVIGSAPLYCDRSSFADALGYITRYGMEHLLPANVMTHLRKGAAGDLPETPETPNSRLPHFLIGSNRIALEAIASHVDATEISVEIVTDRLSGEASNVARELVRRAKIVQASGERLPRLLIYGGETTVTLTGSGRGGRNQEMALAALLELGNHPGITLLSGGSDGIDGSSDAAGGVADAESFRKAQHDGIDLVTLLADNDSNRALGALDDLIVTGPTGTNVMDITLVLIDPPTKQ